MSAFLLLHTNSHNERHYFVESGEWHTSENLGRIRLINRTTPDKACALRFDTAPEAAQVLVDAGNPTEWEIVGQ